MVVKLDMSKAYDRVEWVFLEWVFLERLMVKLGFAEQWVSLIMACLRSRSYFVLLNGEPCGLIHPSKAIRQGDPIS